MKTEKEVIDTTNTTAGYADPFSDEVISRVDRMTSSAEKNGWNSAILEVHDKMKQGELTSADVLKMFKR